MIESRQLNSTKEDLHSKHDENQSPCPFPPSAASQTRYSVLAVQLDSLTDQSPAGGRENPPKKQRITDEEHTAPSSSSSGRGAASMGTHSSSAAPRQKKLVLKLKMTAQKITGPFPGDQL